MFKQTTILIVLFAMLIVPTTAHSKQVTLPKYTATQACKVLYKTHSQQITCILRFVFPKKDVVKARNVSWCESRWNPKARNGQYLGAFQMGKRERSTYGHHYTFEGQSRAARAYHKRSGWNPWKACQ